MSYLGGTVFAKVTPVADRLLRVSSPRAGGAYLVSHRTKVTYLANLNSEEKARLTTWLVEERSRRVECPTVTSEIVQYVRRNPSLPAHERAYRLLQYLVELSETVGRRVCLYSRSSSVYLERKPPSHSSMAPDARNILERSDTAAARSESTNIDEVGFCWDFSRNEGGYLYNADSVVKLPTVALPRSTPPQFWSMDTATLKKRLPTSILPKHSLLCGSTAAWMNSYTRV